MEADQLEGMVGNADFDVIRTINQQFPTEESLSGLDGFLRQLRDKISDMDENIMLAVHQQATSGNKAQNDLSAAQRAIEDLGSKTADIKKRAETSEQMVEEICADIKQLDHAKRNLENALRTLKGLQLIMAAAEQLRELAELNQYRECSNLLHAVIPMAKRFEEHKKIHKVRELLDEFGEMKQSIRHQVFEHLRRIDDGIDPSPADIEKFGDACLVVDALGPEAKQDMIAQFSNQQLQDYKSKFRPGLETAALEKTEKRYTALRKLLKNYEDQYEQIFPSGWKVPEQICEDFCRLTKTHLGAVLDKCGVEGPEVGPLLHVLQKTIEFEEELGDRFAEQVLVDESTGEVIETEVTELSDLYEELQQVDTTTTAGIRKKYELLRKIETQESANTTAASVSNTVTRPSTKFRGLISNVFEQYMSVYINAEERNMRQMIARAVSEEKWGVGDSFTKVLDSSAQLFLGIKKSLQRCVALNKAQPLFDLHNQVFCACLQDYADALRARVTEAGEADINVVICLIINTADYCYETSGELAESMKKAVRGLGSDKLADDIAVSNEQAEFRSVQNYAIRELVSNLMGNLQKAFTMLAKMPWGMIQEVGDHSPYIDEMSEVLNLQVPKFASTLVPAFFNMFCNKFVEAFIPKYIDTIFSCKNVDVIAVQQLLLDTGAMRSLLLKIPSMGDTTPSNMFTKLTNRDMAKVEDLMKTLMSDKDSMVEVFLTFVKDGTVQDFQRVCELKGLKKLEVDTLIQVLQRRLPKK